MGFVVHAGKTAGCFLSDDHMKMDPSVDLAGRDRGRFLSEVDFSREMAGCSPSKDVMEEGRGKRIRYSWRL